ncbi:MAG: ComEC family competence protein [Bacteroidales bacterium]|jgi:competence protein ComEC|nr:ComEC family competence protein [Bacteroidales bacterium]
MNFSHFPVLKALCPYVCGVILGYLLPKKEINLLFLIFVLIFFCIVFIFFYQKKNYYLQCSLTGMLLFSFIVAGYLSIFFHFHKNPDSINSEKLSQKQTWVAEVRELPREREKSYKVIAKLYSLNDSTSWITKKVILYFQKDSIIKNCRVGDKLIVHTKLSFIEPPKNPYQFDYKKFTQRKGIYLTGYAPAYSWEKIENIKKRTVKRYASNLQRFLSNKLIESGLSAAEYSVAAAILLGNDETLEPELRASYAATGVSHILCVSGMHVGVIFMIMGFLLKPLDSTVKSRFIKNVILLLAVWLYANITGLAPSVTRSATMFSFVIVSKFLKRKTNVFHSLFASLFILLSINPILLFEMGFQLSYLAVFSIVLFQTKITKLYKPKYKVMNYFWELSAVSLVAQFASAPIVTYYFGQFPNYFLLTNMFIIPISFVMTVTGVATLAFSFSDIISKGFGFLLNIELKIMNTVVFYVEKLPGALTTNISINYMQVLVLYSFFIALLIFTKNKKRLLLCLLALLNIFILIKTINMVKNKQHIDVVNYSISKCVAFQFCYNGQAILVSDSIGNTEDKRYQFNIQNHDRVKNLQNKFINIGEDFENSFFCKKGNYIFFQDSIYVLDRNKIKVVN